jgi:hypothetical protein
MPDPATNTDQPTANGTARQAAPSISDNTSTSGGIDARNSATAQLTETVARWALAQQGVTVHSVTTGTMGPPVKGRMEECDTDEE